MSHISDRQQMPTSKINAIVELTFFKKLKEVWLQIYIYEPYPFLYTLQKVCEYSDIFLCTNMFFLKMHQILLCYWVRLAEKISYEVPLHMEISLGY